MLDQAYKKWNLITLSENEHVILTIINIINQKLVRKCRSPGPKPET